MILVVDWSTFEECPVGVQVIETTLIHCAGCRVAQVRVVFSSPPAHADRLFSGIAEDQRPIHLAYVEWFSPFPHSPNPDHGLYPVLRSYSGTDRLCSIVDARRIVRSAHLLPKSGKSVPRTWSSSNVLEQAKSSWLNAFLDRNTYAGN